MSWLLGISDSVLPGAGLFVVLDTLVLFSCWISLLALRFDTTLAAPVVALLCVLTPQLLIYPGIVWKDVLFAAAGIASFACLVHASHKWTAAPVRFLLIAFTIVFSSLAALARQNGAIVLVSACVAMGWTAARNEPLNRLRSALSYGAATALIAGSLVIVSLLALSSRVQGHSGTLAQLRALQIYDIVGEVVEQPHVRLSRLAADDPAVVRMIQTRGVRLYSPATSDAITDDPVFDSTFRNPATNAISAQWLELILQHPWLYLGARARVFWRVITTPDSVGCPRIELGINGPTEDLHALGIKPRWDARDIALYNYAQLFMRTPVFSHVFYLLMDVSALAVLLWRRSSSDIVIACMLISALMFSASFYLIAMACDYRYLYYLDMSSLFAIFYIAITSPLKWRLDQLP